MIITPTTPFTEARKGQIITSLTHEAWMIGEMLAERSNRVQKLIESRESVVLVDIDTLYETLLQSAYERIKQSSQDEIGPEDLVALGYICKFLAELISGELTEPHKEMQQHPYVHDFIGREDFRTAGDTALYGFWFLVEKRKNQLTYKDYIHMAVQCYLRWYQKTPLSIGYILAERVEKFLPNIEDLPRKIFGDVRPIPNLQLVTSQK